ncbi:MAG: Crp/Fnr family transcriptional regulator [Clostridium sp.]|nr:Crp/Fnr family transcriptional regulator [Clostridium sp.]
MNDIENKLKELEVFQHIHDKTIERIAKVSEVKKYKAGEMLFADKEEVNVVYIVICGLVSLYKIDESGQKKVIFIFGKGKVINDVILQELPASINCSAFEDSYILCIGREKLLDIMNDDFELCKNIIISLSAKTRRLYRQLKNTPSSIKLEKRLAAKIYKLAKDYGVESKEGVVVNMALTITYMADLLGSQRETVSRALKLLQEKKLIKYKNKKIIVYDIDKIALFFKTS